MISRRKIRIKVLQSLYTSEILEDVSVDEDEIVKKFHRSVDELKNGVFATLYWMIKICKYSLIEQNNQESKHLESSRFIHSHITQLAENPIIVSISDDPNFQGQIKNIKFLHNIDAENVKILFRKFIALPACEQYLSNTHKTIEDHKTVLYHLIEEVMMEDYGFNDFMEQHVTTWDDDDVEVYTIVTRIIDLEPSRYNFKNLGITEIMNYGTDLLKITIQKRTQFKELISPKLINWDSKRIAKIDTLSLYQGLCEFLYFPTIPVKVTINEYIDIVKQYGAEQSRQFVNAVLDGIKTDLEKDNRIQKQNTIDK